MPLETLDDFAGRHGLAGPGVISLDIEGHEPEALAGGLGMIRALRPKLQVSVYHAPEHLFSIALWLDRMLDDYAFFLGHHDAYHSETDLYVAPRERL